MSERIRELAQRVVKLGCERGLSVGAVESCTGGLVCAALTDIAGSSATFRGGIVSYDPAVKHDLVGVSQEVIDDPALGVVSEPCALQMASGGRSALACDVCVSVTGIAGPGGAEPGKPVGTVWFGLAYPGARVSDLQLFDGDRSSVRGQAVCHALELLCEGIEKS